MGPFPSAHRVRKRSEFQQIQSAGRRVTTPHFVLLLYAHGSSLTAARLGLTVSRKVGNAVVRNRAKRLLREAFRATRELWSSDMDLVVIVRHMTPDVTLAQVVQEWRRVERNIRRRTAEARKDREKRDMELASDG